MIAEMEIVVGWAAIFIGFAGGSFLLGEWLAMRCSSREQRKNLKLYQDWGLGQELSTWPLLPGKFVKICVSLVLIPNLALFVLLVCKVGLTEAKSSIAVAVGPYLNYGIIILFLILGSAGYGFIIQKKRLCDFNDKVTALKSLGGHSLKGNQVVKLISMYDALHIAPTIFWNTYFESYKCGPGAKTDQEFRELVTPYYHSRANQHTRQGILISVVVAAASLGIPPLLKALI